MSLDYANPVAPLRDLYAKSCERTKEVIESCPPDRHLFCLGEGKATPLWLVGHLGCITDLLGRVYGLGTARLFPQEWRLRFTPHSFGGEAITAAADSYPSWSEVADVYDKVTRAYVEDLGSIGPEDLGQPSKGDPPEALRNVIPTVWSSIRLNIGHDSHHRGQLALLANCPRP